MDSTSNDRLLFEARKYAQGQFTFVPDGDSLLLGSAYGSRRQFLARVPLPEVGAWLLEAHIADEAQRANTAFSFFEPLSPEEISGLDIRIDL